MKTILLLLAVIFSSNADAIERFAIGAYSSRALTCRESVFQARNLCLRGAQEFMKNHDVVEPPACPTQACSCSAGVAMPEAVCPGSALYEDGQDIEGKRVTIQQQFLGRGNSCRLARHEARRKMYYWASAVSKKVPVLSFRLARWGNCPCSTQGMPAVVCSGAITYLKASTDEY